MSREMVVTFFPVTFGELLKNHAPGLYYYLLPDWVADRCPMPSIDLRAPGIGAVKLYWPAVGIAIVLGFLLSLILGSQTLVRALQQGSQSRQGLFLWSCSLLWYACMCTGGLFCHCLHVYPLPHMLDLVGTGLSSLCVVAAFAAFTGHVDDRTVRQRLGFGLFALGFVVVAVWAPPALQEQLYVVPALVATIVGGVFIHKHSYKVRRVEEAQRWMWLAGLGVVLAFASVPMDKWLCVTVGADFALLFWFFLGCDIAILSVHQFAVAVTDKNLHFTDTKTQ